MEDASTPPPRERKPFQSFRSTASNNWRVKDDSPRVASPPQQPRDNQDRQGSRFQRDNNGDESQAYSPRPRNNYNAQPRERNELPAEVTTPRLYVGNLLYTAQAADIESFFLTSGFAVTNVSMSIDPMTGRNPSYCFVDLESAEEAKRAMEELNGKEVMGRTVRINPGVGRKERDGPRDSPRMKPFDGGRGSVRDGTAMSPGLTLGENKPATERWNRTDAASQWTKPQEHGKRLYVGGLPQLEPQAAVEAEMQSLIANLDFGVEVVAVSKLIAPHPSKASEPGDHYYLFIDFANTEGIDKVIETLDGSISPWSENGQGKLKVNRAKDNTGRKSGREQGDRPGPREPQRDGQAERSFGRPSWRDSTQ